MVQDTIKIIYEEADKTIKNNIINILKSLNIEDSYNDKYLIRFRLLFQEHFSVIFIFTDEICKNIKNSMFTVINLYVNFLEYKDIIISDLESQGFKNFIQNAFKLCIFMQLHDPKLSFNIKEFSNRKLSYHFYNKSDFLNIDGFGKDLTPCLVILPPPMLRSNFVYQGIKPAVYMIANASEDIKRECESYSESIKSKSFSSTDIANLKHETEKVQDDKIRSIYIIIKKKEKKIQYSIHLVLIVIQLILL